MLQYKDYLNRVLEYTGELDEKAFEEISELFPNIDQIDWDNYYPGDNDATQYILDNLITSVTSEAFIEDYSEMDKSVSLSYVLSLEELDDLKKCLDSNGWTIDNYEELKEEAEEEEKEAKETEAKENLIQKIRINATLDQLQEFCNSLT